MHMGALQKRSGEKIKTKEVVRPLSLLPILQRVINCGEETRQRKGGWDF